MAHPHSDDPFDSDDPLTMMGVAMVGMTLQEMAEREAEQEQRQRRARLSPWQRAEEDRRNKQLAKTAWRIAAVFVGVVLFFLCLLSLAGSVGY